MQRLALASLGLVLCACSSGSGSSASSIIYAGTWDVVATETRHGTPPIAMSEFGPVRIDQDGIFALSDFYRVNDGAGILASFYLGRGALTALERSPARTVWAWDSMTQPGAQQQVDLVLRPNPDVAGELILEAEVISVLGSGWPQAWGGRARLARQQ